MEITTIIFYCFSLVLVLSALKVITAKNPVHAALFLVLSFFTAAAIWMLLKAEFLAITLVLVYVGAVMVLFLFVVMMIDVDIENLRRDFWTYVPMGAFVGAVIIMEMAVVLTKAFMGRSQPVQELPKTLSGPNTQALGKLIYTDYIYAFEVAGAVLLLAIVAAVALTARRRKDSKAQKVADQIRVQRKDRVRLVSMPAEKAAPAAPTETNR
ncbi:NADH-quinone oxidoreductase subunit J [Ralstonia syzygii subsp. celebesensis]|uniref:NADH-quinone oxidoreductase subunit J n=4 Tax=Ralstonia solanacearum species complex TaxID=3116862 RepID=A0AAD0SDK4_RALSL|nr:MULTISPECIES: NADH-quinone oxidoreductase subunit J [Ralstonia solanacearum species complex]CCA82004.1 NADH-quinone oxidoreductase subunit J [blood disease bacterium R229]BEU71666.1 NADH-quinone oxidoreductase subunit J [Ralstonia pseudosolanacearum]AMP37208.1 NADH:ubiquinone oxidoreductase subunit J [Ralstonia solanacearum]AQW31251.1 NADH:ubiquinone oxidoreductase subunit J [blood disease bacterium A2-HR MARDI]AXV76603.1 NADH:ubiquinone oxidoreductase subunit J [Ralstonia solanacearum]